MIEPGKYLPGWAAALLLAAPAAAATDPVAIKCAAGPIGECGAAAVATRARAVPAFAPDPEPVPNETLVDAIDAAWRTAPTVQQQRYRVRMSDEDYAQALAETRPTANVTITGLYNKTVPGETTQATRFVPSSPIITSNSQTGTATISQPLLTGGKAHADREAALAEIGADRETLRGTEGTLLLDVITAYADIRRDAATVRFYGANWRQMQATLEEVKARKVAGELTRTDIGLAENQLAVTESAYNSAVQQLEQDRASYATLVGRDPRNLAEPPPLPGLPATIDAAFDQAEVNNPDLSAAIATERQSRAQIESARATGRPTLTLTGAATLTGQAVPFYLRNQDQTFAGQAVLSIPLFSGGAVRSRVAQAEDQNGIDRFGIEGTRRQMVQAILNAWNAMATAQRNVINAARQVRAGRVYDEGTFAEYRAGLRSTFDVLYAHSTRRDAEIAAVSAQHDLFVAQAALLRQLGSLEARALLTTGGVEDVAADLLHAERRAALPGESVIRALDDREARTVHQRGLVQPPESAAPMAIVAASPPSADPLPLAGHSPDVPVPRTTGTPTPDRGLTRP